MNKMIGYLICVSLLLFSCEEKSGPMEPMSSNDKIFDIQWTSTIEEAYEVGSLADGLVYRDWFLVPGDINDPLTLYAFNTVDGNKDWVYNNTSGLINDEFGINQIYENLYIAITNHGMVAVNLDIQELEWEIPFRSLGYESNNGNNIHNGYLYHNFSIEGVGLDSEAAAIVRVNIEDGSYEEIYRATNDTEGLKTTSPPIVYTAANGHEIMIFNERPNAELVPQDVKQEIVAWDITNGVELWRSLVTNTYASNGLHSPAIYNDDIVITGGDWSMYGFDIRNGDNLWKTSMPGYTQWGIWTKTNHLIKNDRLYVNEGGHQIHCLNPIDGTFIWQNLEDAPNCSDNIHYYEKEDYLIFTSWGLGSVMVIDALTGELVHRERPSDDST